MRAAATLALAAALAGCAPAAWVYEGALLQRHREQLMQCLQGSRHADHDEACWNAYKIQRSLDQRRVSETTGT